MRIICFGRGCLGGIRLDEGEEARIHPARIHSTIEYIISSGKTEQSPA
jgi:hypothetical protein